MALLTADSSALLVVDLQEKTVAEVADAAAVIENVVRLVLAAGRLDVDVWATEQDPDELGTTVAPVAGRLAVPALTRSAFAADPHLTPGTAVLAGCEAHVGVLQTALALRGAGRSVAVVADAVGSRSDADRERGLDRMRAHDIDVMTTEMVLCEWVATTANPAYREVRELIR